MICFAVRFTGKMCRLRGCLFTICVLGARGVGVLDCCGVLTGPPGLGLNTLVGTSGTLGVTGDWVRGLCFGIVITQCNEGKSDVLGRG